MEDVISFIRSESQTPQDVNGFLFIEMFDLVLTSNTIASTELTNLWNQWFNKTTFLSKVNLYISSSTDYFLFDRLLSIYLFMASQDSTSTSVYELSRILSESMTTAIQNLQEIVRDKSTTSISGKSKSLCLSFLLLRKSAFASGLIVKFNQCFENQICIDVNLCSILPQQEQPISSKQWLQSIGLAAVHSEQPFNTTLLQVCHNRISLYFPHVTYSYRFVSFFTERSINNKVNYMQFWVSSTFHCRRFTF